MRTALLAAAALSVMSATPALAATFIQGTTQNYTFVGTATGTFAELSLTLTTADFTTNTFLFNYMIDNTSDTLLNPQVRLTSFGFDTGITENPTATVWSGFDSVVYDQNFPDSIGFLDVCVTAGNCQGSNGGLLAPAGPLSGSFTLDYLNTLALGTSLDLTDVSVRFQSTGLLGQGSGTGSGVEIPDPQGGPVPEPATWAMMLLGFGAIGSAMRRRRPDTTRVRYNFA